MVEEPSYGEFFGFASMLEQTPHQTDATAVDESTCLEVNRNDIAVLLQRMPRRANVRTAAQMRWFVGNGD